MYGSGPHPAFGVRPPADHMATANARVHVTAMLESRHAFDRLDEIAAVPRIDALTIRPTDPGQEPGVPRPPAPGAGLPGPPIRAGRAARQHGKTAGLGGGTFASVAGGVR